VDRLRSRADVLERDVPEPGGRRLRQDERHTEADAVPLAPCDEPCRAQVDRGGTRRAGPRGRFDPRPPAPEGEVRGAALDLAAEERIQDDVADVDAPDRTVVVHLHAQPRGTLELDRPAHRRLLSPDGGVPRSISSMAWFAPGRSGDGSRSNTAM